MKTLYKALAEFQYEIPVIHQNTSGYGYTYADLATIIETIRPFLKKHGLGFSQNINGDALETIVFHFESGECLKGTVTIQKDAQLKNMNSYQVLGAAITYYRRYSLSAMLGLVTDKDNDANSENTPKEIKKTEVSKEVQQYPSTKKDIKKLPFLNKGTDLYDKAIQKLEIGEYTVNRLAEFFQLSEETKKDLQKYEIKK